MSQIVPITVTLFHYIIKVQWYCQNSRCQNTINLKEKKKETQSFEKNKIKSILAVCHFIMLLNTVIMQIRQSIRMRLAWIFFFLFLFEYLKKDLTDSLLNCTIICWGELCAGLAFEAEKSNSRKNKVLNWKFTCFYINFVFETLRYM